MAFSNNPLYSTYSTKKLKIIHDLDLAPAGTEISSLLGGMVNILPFKDDTGELYGETRYSIQAESIAFTHDANHIGMSDVSTSAICRGLYVWEEDQDFYNYFVVLDDAVGSRMFMKNYPDPSGFGWMQCSNLTDGGVLLHTKAQTVVRFTDYVDATNIRRLVMSDGIDLYRIDDGGGLTRCVDPDMPTPHLPFPIAMDGYIFLAKGAISHATGYADIYNSDLNNPMSWTAGNFISAEMYPDRLKAIVRVNNYILAIGQDSAEYFYDAGNATGSPLARYESAALPFGCVHPNTIAYLKDTVMFLSNPGNGEDCFVLVKGFKAQVIEAKPVLQLLKNQLYNGTTTSSKLRSGFFHQDGKLFYFLCFDGTQTDTGWTTETFIYSVECDMWVRTRSDMYNAGQPSGYAGFPILFAHDSTGRFPYTFIAGQFSNTAKVFFGHLDPAVKYDQFDVFNQYNIYQEINVPAWSDDSQNKKNMHRLHVDYQVRNDLDNVTGSLGFILNYSDDQGVTWFPSYPLGGKGNQFPFFQQLGSFRERMLKLINYSTRIRFFGFEVEINKGVR